jgi:hypothetical protein
MDMPLRLDNASALPTSPQQPQQQKKEFKPRFKIDQAACPMPDNQPARTPRPGEIKSDRWATSSRNPPGVQIGTPGRLRRNSHTVTDGLDPSVLPLGAASFGGETETLSPGPTLHVMVAERTHLCIAAADQSSS